VEKADSLDQLDDPQAVPFAQHQRYMSCPANVSSWPGADDGSVTAEAAPLGSISPPRAGSIGRYFRLDGAQI
jgi:hypothetical protein